ncbi:MAG: hypothetical protein JXA21_04905 [Anaerolineae bacterium]|nr:hypothetical protein [Anaerolineae bacterium]
MSEYQLSFGEEPNIQQVQDIWKVTGLLTAWDIEGRANKFYVCVSGATRAVVHEFVTTYESNYDIRPEVIQQSLTDPEPAPGDGSQSFTVGASEAQLKIEISPLEIQTPQPYRIVHHIAIMGLLTEDATRISCGHEIDLMEVSYGKLEPQQVKEDQWEVAVVFQAPKAKVKCKVDDGSLATICLSEEDGDKWELRGSIKENITDKVWLPGPTENDVLAQISSGKWRVEVRGGRDAKSTFTLTPCIKG